MVLHSIVNTIHIIDVTYFPEFLYYLVMISYYILYINVTSVLQLYRSINILGIITCKIIIYIFCVTVLHLRAKFLQSWVKKKVDRYLILF